MSIYAMMGSGLGLKLKSSNFLRLLIFFALVCYASEKKGYYLVCPMGEEKTPRLVEEDQKWRGAVWFNPEWRGSVGAVWFKHRRYQWTPEAKGKKNNWGEKLGWHPLRKSKCSYCCWWQERLELCPKDIPAGSDAVTRASRSSWWAWDDGSRPFHWRWPKEYQSRIWDGIKSIFRRSPHSTGYLKRTQRIQLQKNKL
jgi:hypothetical protein